MTSLYFEIAFEFFNLIPIQRTLGHYFCIRCQIYSLLIWCILHFTFADSVSDLKSTFLIYRRKSRLLFLPIGKEMNRYCILIYDNLDFYFPVCVFLIGYLWRNWLWEYFSWNSLKSCNSLSTPFWPFSRDLFSIPISFFVDYYVTIYRPIFNFEKSKVNKKLF